MPKVICTLPNASEEISGVKFVSHADGVISEDVSDEVAAGFVAVPGYKLAGAQSPEIEAAKADLLARAAAIADFKVKANWGLDRLKAEVEGAEKAVADAAAEAAAKSAAE